MPAVATTARKTSMAKLAKEKKTTKAAKPSAARSHPPYFQMIKEAILALRERTGSSSVAIAKHMEENHKGELPANFKKMLTTQLRNSAAKGRLVKVKASFKLSDEAKKDAKPAKEKKTVTEKVKKPSKKTEAVTGAKRKAPSTTTAAKTKKKPETKVKPAMAKKAAAVKKVKKVPKSPAKAKKPKSIKSPGAKKARVARA